MPTNSLKEALLNIQRSAPKVQKDGVNPHLQSSYMTLDDVMSVVLGLLNEEEVLFTAKLQVNPDGRPVLDYTFTHLPTKETDAGTAPLMLVKASPQDLGSAVTYTRRYILVTYLNIVTDKDDDGHQATVAARTADAHATAPKPPAQAARPANQPPAEAEQAKLLEKIAAHAAEMRENFPKVWEQATKWADEREIDLDNPAPDKLRAVEGAFRRKLDTVKVAKQPDAKPGTKPDAKPDPAEQKAEVAK